MTSAAAHHQGLFELFWLHLGCWLLVCSLGQHSCFFMSGNKIQHWYELNSELTRRLRSEAESIIVVAVLIFWSITADVREQLDATGRSRLDYRVLNCPIIKPTCITPVQTLGPCCQRRNASSKLTVWTMYTTIDNGVEASLKHIGRNTISPCFSDRYPKTCPHVCLVQFSLSFWHGQRV